MQHKRFSDRLAQLERLEQTGAATVDYGADTLTCDELLGALDAIDAGAVRLDRGVLMGDVGDYLGAVAPSACGPWLNVMLAKVDRAMVRYRRRVNARAGQALGEWRAWLIRLLEESYAETHE